MTANAAFTGFYSKAMRDELRCMSGDETKLFVTIALYSGPDGMARPGVRELHDATGYHTKVVSALLKTLQEKRLVMVLRQNERDPLTGQMLSDVYIVNPEIVLVSNPTLWQENRFRHASMPESHSSVKSAQAEQNRIRKQNQEEESAKQTASEGAAMLSKTNAPHQPDMATRSGEASSTAGSQRQPNSTPQARTPPSSAASPPAKMGFIDSLAVDAIRRQVPDMAHEKAAELVALYGVDQFTAAVLAMKARAKKVAIKKPTGWIIRNLQQGARK